MAIYVTGFEPFGNNETNPSLIALEEALSLGYEGSPLKVSYGAVDHFFQSQAGTKRRFLLFGLAAQRADLSLEQIAFNETKAKLLDVDGLPPKMPFIEENEVISLQTSINLEDLSLKLSEEKIPNHISFDAGRYLCNYSYFKALLCTGGDALFVHIPALSPTFDEQMLRKATRILLSFLD